MPAVIPPLELSYGQLLWAATLGQTPSRILQDRARYLRRLGVPRDESAPETGRGNRLAYDFYDLAALGVGLTALSYRFRPGEASKAIVSDRERFAQTCRTAWYRLDENVLGEPWVRTRGQHRTVPDGEVLIRIRERSADSYGQFDFIDTNDDPADVNDLFEPVLRFPGEPYERLVSLTRWLPQWVAWALEAPILSRGPSG